MGGFLPWYDPKDYWGDVWDSAKEGAKWFFDEPILKPLADKLKDPTVKRLAESAPGFKGLEALTGLISGAGALAGVGSVAGPTTKVPDWTDIVGKEYSEGLPAAMEVVAPVDLATLGAGVAAKGPIKGLQGLGKLSGGLDRAEALYGGSQVASGLASGNLGEAGQGLLRSVLGGAGLAANHLNRPINLEPSSMRAEAPPVLPNTVSAMAEGGIGSSEGGLASVLGFDPDEDSFIKRLREIRAAGTDIGPNRPTRTIPVYHGTGDVSWAQAKEPIDPRLWEVAETLRETWDNSVALKDLYNNDFDAYFRGTTGGKAVPPEPLNLLDIQKYRGRQKQLENFTLAEAGDRESILAGLSPEDRLKVSKHLDIMGKMANADEFLTTANEKTLAYHYGPEAARQIIAAKTNKLSPQRVQELLKDEGFATEPTPIFATQREGVGVPSTRRASSSNMEGGPFYSTVLRSIAEGEYAGGEGAALARPGGLLDLDVTTVKPFDLEGLKPRDFDIRGRAIIGDLIRNAENPNQEAFYRESYERFKNATTNREAKYLLDDLLERSDYPLPKSELTSHNIGRPPADRLGSGDWKSPLFSRETLDSRDQGNLILDALGYDALTHRDFSSVDPSNPDPRVYIPFRPRHQVKIRNAQPTVALKDREVGDLIDQLKGLEPNQANRGLRKRLVIELKNRRDKYLRFLRPDGTSSVLDDPQLAPRFLEEQERIVGDLDTQLKSLTEEFNNYVNNATPEERARGLYSPGSKGDILERKWNELSSRAQQEREHLEGAKAYLDPNRPLIEKAVTQSGFYEKPNVTLTPEELESAIPGGNRYLEHLKSQLEAEKAFMEGPEKARFLELDARWKKDPSSLNIDERFALNDFHQGLDTRPNRANLESAIKVLETGGKLTPEMAKDLQGFAPKEAPKTPPQTTPSDLLRKTLTSLNLTKFTPTTLVKAFKDAGVEIDQASVLPLLDELASQGWVNKKATGTYTLQKYPSSSFRQPRVEGTPEGQLGEALQQSLANPTLRVKEAPPLAEGVKPIELGDMIEGLSKDLGWKPDPFESTRSKVVEEGTSSQKIPTPDDLKKVAERTLQSKYGENWQNKMSEAERATFNDLQRGVLPKELQTALDALGPDKPSPVPLTAKEKRQLAIAEKQQRLLENADPEIQAVKEALISKPVSEMTGKGELPPEPPMHRGTGITPEEPKGKSKKKTFSITLDDGTIHKVKATTAEAAREYAQGILDRNESGKVIQDVKEFPDSLTRAAQSPLSPREVKAVEETGKAQAVEEIGKEKKVQKLGEKITKKVKREMVLEEKRKVRLIDEITKAQNLEEIQNRKTQAGAEKKVSEKSFLDDLTDLPKTLKSAFDISFSGRQGLFLVNRGEGIKALWKGLKSGKAANHEMVKKDLDTRPNKKYYEQFGLNQISYDPTNVDVTKVSEQFPSQMAEKIPGVKQTQRIYNDQSNLLRADMFDSMAEKWSAIGKTPEKNPELYKGLADYLNVLTGRAPLHKSLAQAGAILNKTFWSPQFLKSRAQILNPAFYAKLPREVQKMALRDVGGTVSVLATALTAVAYIAKAQGYDVDVESDPRHTNFGKLRVGEHSYDFFTGLLPIVRTASRIATSVKKTPKGDYSIKGGLGLGTESKKLPKAPFGQSAFGELGGFIEGKTSPLYQITKGAMTGKDYYGEEYGLDDLLKDIAMPMGLEDIGEGGVAGLPGLTGIGYQNAKERERHLSAEGITTGGKKKRMVNW